MYYLLKKIKNNTFFQKYLFYLKYILLKRIKVRCVL